MNHCIYVYRLAMPRTGSAIAAAIMHAAIRPILYRITGTAMNMRQCIVNAMVTAMAVMTGMTVTTGEMVIAVMTEMMTAAMGMVKEKAATDTEKAGTDTICPPYDIPISRHPRIKAAISL